MSSGRIRRWDIRHEDYGESDMRRFVQTQRKKIAQNRGPGNKPHSKTSNRVNGIIRL